ncbi:MAG: nicotinate phosphoribosyltransferase [Pigmentiphaga sp.]|nr:nicotinate phosphoribosyltransferase [Pigmentiphaga sp.]
MIIESLLDTDLSKFSTMQVVLHHFPAAQVEYRYQCQTPGIDLRPCLPDIREAVTQLCRLRFTPEELAYLGSLRFIKSDFVDFLGLFHLPEQCIAIDASSERPGELDITIRGSWLHTILFEIPVLSIINEVYNRRESPRPPLAEGRRRLRAKIDLIRQEPTRDEFRVADYGTRRRFSRVWHDEVLRTLAEELGPTVAGTGNVALARRYGLKPLGTMEHEYLQACQALGPRLRESQVYALETWAREYRGDLGIALSDVYGMEAFFRDFDMFFCKLFDGARHDSGDPFVWAERLLRHYEFNRVDPRSKTLVFSDNITIPLALELARRFHSQCRLSFGIGAKLTNDLGPDPLRLTMKMVRCNGQPVAKVSDIPDNALCDDPAYLAYLRQVFDAA